MLPNSETLIVSSRCDLPKRGWFCIKPKGHRWSCPAYPHFWNLRRLNLYFKWQAWKWEFRKPIEDYRK